jgi:hypothetical protein
MVDGDFHCGPAFHFTPYCCGVFFWCIRHEPFLYYWWNSFSITLFINSQKVSISKKPECIFSRSVLYSGHLFPRSRQGIHQYYPFRNTFSLAYLHRNWGLLLGRLPLFFTKEGVESTNRPTLARIRNTIP